MSSLFHRSKPFNTILEGYVDCHSHILPGVDDGVQSIDDSLAILKRYEAAGVSGVWLTPHVMEDVPNTPEHIKEVFGQLLSAYDGPVKLFLASEHMMDSLFEQRLFRGEVMPIGGNYLLVETSYFNPPYDLDGIIGRVFSAGYFPILAHPERYVYMGRKDYDRLKQRGVRFQMNLTSLVGLYGREAKDKARTMLRKGYYNFLGTDIHRLSLLDRLDKAEIDAADVERLQPCLEACRGMWLEHSQI